MTGADETFGKSARRLDQPADQVMLQFGPHLQESRHDPAQPLLEAEPQRPPAEAHLEASEAETVNQPPVMPR